MKVDVFATKKRIMKIIKFQVGHFISQFHVLFLSVALGGLATQPTTYMLLGEPFFIAITRSSLHPRQQTTFFSSSIPIIYIEHTHER